jgi:hypothetical protein
MRLYRARIVCKLSLSWNQSGATGLRRAIAQVNMKSLMRLRPSLLFTALLALFLAMPLFAADSPDIFPLSEIHPGLKGVAYTIFSGDQIQQMDVTVIGVLKDGMGPKEDIILVQLAGADVAKTGVVAGMSGSPVYFDGKLAGAISLKMGIFAKDAIAGVTPIQNMLDIPQAMPAQEATSVAPDGNNGPRGVSQAAIDTQSFDSPAKVPLGGDQFLIPIETPLVFSGLSLQTLSRFSPELQSYGLSAMAGGTVPPSPADAQLKPGDMVGMDLVSGDMSVAAGCTVTAIIHGRVFVCGHPFNSFGNVSMPMSRAYVVTTLASDLESTKIMNTGGVIGTFQQDRLTGVVGQLGAGPPTLPVTVNIDFAGEHRHFHFNVTQNPKLTPLLVAICTYNGIIGNTAYTDGTTLQLDGQIGITGHPSVDLRDMFIPLNAGIPDAYPLALDVETAFARIYTNPYEIPKVQNVTINVNSMPQSRWSGIDGAWANQSEAQPGQTVNIKVLLHPYRSAPFIQEVPITIPAQAARGSLQILVSDADALNRMRELFPGQEEGKLQGLDELIRIMNRERQNDRLYVTLWENAPTLLVEDKELPNVPASEINVLDQHRTPGGAQLLYQSEIGEQSIPMNQVITGQQYLVITIK